MYQFLWETDIWYVWSVRFTKLKTSWFKTFSIECEIDLKGSKFVWVIGAAIDQRFCKEFRVPYGLYEKRFTSVRREAWPNNDFVAHKHAASDVQARKSDNRFRYALACVENFVPAKNSVSRDNLRLRSRRVVAR